MSRTIHVAITRRVRKEHAEAFERGLAEFARRSLDELAAQWLNPTNGDP
ncbi:hypothetical protein WME79_22820 [Sorangium sp. So ce726]